LRLEAAAYRVTEATEIVVQHDPVAGAGFDWPTIAGKRIVRADSPEHRILHGVQYLQEALGKLTGREPPIRSRRDLSRGIIVTLLKNAPAEVQNDPAVKAALGNDGSDAYNDREAFFCRSEPERLLIVANTADGLAVAMPALLETVGYEVLGMGPNWVHVPREFRERPEFDVALAGRPSFYIRSLWATTGQDRGVGTICGWDGFKLSDPADEPVERSWSRWAIAMRGRSQSMPKFPGHALYFYHKQASAEMVATGSTVGFLVPQTHLGLDAARPAASEANAGHLWLNTDGADKWGRVQAFVSNGREWRLQDVNGYTVNLDFTAPLGRRLILDELKRKAEEHFAGPTPDEPLIFGTDPEDGSGIKNIGTLSRPEHRNWYLEETAQQGVAWPQPYVLHGYRGVNQPQEIFDPTSVTDQVFGLNNWLLREFDRWIESLPEQERVTASGRSKKELVRCSLLSYNYHDVPPHFNLDPRIRVMIAGYPKHRGLGEWKNFATNHEMAAAFQVMLPREPSGVYRIMSYALNDYGMDGLPAKWNAAPERIVAEIHSAYDAGIRALSYETDFNFGKFGLLYYLQGKMLWNAKLTTAELTALRERWLQRAYGSGATAMREYHDFLLPDNFPANAPGTWAKAIRFIEAADAKIAPDREPDAQRRLDDLKQFWLYYYLVDSGAAEQKTPEFMEFTWKGQMSYMTAMHMVFNRHLELRSDRTHRLVAPELSGGPAHYTTAETAVWWKKILNHWPLAPVSYFADAVLADRSRGRTVDLNDLIPIAEFAAFSGTGKPFSFNSVYAPNVVFLTSARAGEEFGAKLAWPMGPVPFTQGPKEVPFGIEYWDRQSKQWTEVVDLTLSTVASQTVANTSDAKPRHVAEIRHRATRSGTYRVEIGRGGVSAHLASSGFNVATQQYDSRRPLTFASRPGGHTQDPAYFYLPRGTKTLDLETWDKTERKRVEFLQYVPGKGLVVARTIDISRRGTHRIPLLANEGGTLARISGNGFAFPLLYSVPQLWAKSPAELLVPRKIVLADRLTAVE
jgi:hypothetical protein